MAKTQNTANFRIHWARWLVWFAVIAIFSLVLYVARPQETTVEWTDDLAQAQSTAMQTSRLILVEFYKPDEPAFLRMDREVFTRPEVRDALADWIPVRVDVTRFPRTADDYKIDTWPTYVVLSPDGTTHTRVVGTWSAEEFVAFIHSAEQHWTTTQPL